MGIIFIYYYIFISFCADRRRYIDVVVDDRCRNIYTVQNMVKNDRFQDIYYSSCRLPRSSP